MEIGQIVGYGIAIIAGFVMGLLGGGGSVICIPILVYLMHCDRTLATMYAAFIIGVTASVGTVRNIKTGMVSYKAALAFLIPSSLVIYLLRTFVIPANPGDLAQISGYTISIGHAQMIALTFVMVGAGFSMIRGRKNITAAEYDPNESIKLGKIMLYGALVGIVSGVTGAGAGFLIVPVLVLLARLPIKLAIGSALFIIALKSMVFFGSDLLAGRSVDWSLLFSFSAMTVIGIFIGTYTATVVSENRLKQWFGYFILGIAVFIFLRELSEILFSKPETYQIWEQFWAAA